MRILVFEFVSGGGLAGRDLPASLAREGAAMLTALVGDLAVMESHQIVTTTDPRFHLKMPREVEVVSVSGAYASVLDKLIASTDAVWLIAPETDRCLERLAARVERKGKVLLGSSSAAIRAASNKVGLPRRLASYGVLHPATRALRAGSDYRSALRSLGYPVVVKPGRGAGCDGVSLARNDKELRQAMRLARHASAGGPLLVQRYVRGAAASVSLLADGERAVPLAVNAQRMSASRPFSYRGGITPLDHPLAERAAEAAVRACETVPGLRGYVGVDLVLTPSDAFVIEINPRLTTAYLGVRAAIRENVAALALAACAGALPARPSMNRRVGFTSSGRILRA